MGKSQGVCSVGIVARELGIKGFMGSEVGKSKINIIFFDRPHGWELEIQGMYNLGNPRV